MKHKLFTLFVLLTLLLAGLPMGSAQAAPGDTTRVSVDSTGLEGNNNSYHSSISADGRYVAFMSVAANLAAGDTNGKDDIFVRDTQTNATTRVSVDSLGAEGNSASSHPSISADGRYVAFYSDASNLVAGDTNGQRDIFVRDTQTNATTRVSLDSSGAQADNSSSNPSISADGRYVAFYSYATNLVAGDTNGKYDVFVRDTQMNTTTRVSVDSSGAQGNGSSSNPSISADGRYVAFVSLATNLVAGDTNGQYDIFVRDTQMNTTMRISLDSSGAQADSSSYNPSISADGRYVAFYSYATNLVAGDTNGVGDVFVRDTQTNVTARVSLDSSGAEGNFDSLSPSISADGRYVAFESYASNLAAGDTNGYGDIFVRDTQTNATARVSLDSSGLEGNEGSYNSSISANGLYVAFDSDASNLVSGDTNGVTDVFRHETHADPTVILASPPNGSVLHYKRLEFGWYGFAGAAGYELQVSKAADFGKTAIKKSVTISNYSHNKDLEPDTLYYWRVRTKAGKTYGEWSSVWTFTTGNPPPVPKLSAPGNNKTVAGPSPLFDWKDVVAPVGATFDHYEIQIAADAGFTNIVYSASPVPSQDNLAVLTSGTTYYWRVRSVAADGDFSAWSKVRIVIIQ